MAGVLEDPERAGAEVVQRLRRELAGFGLVVEDGLEPLRERAGGRGVQDEPPELAEVLLE